MPAKCPMCCLVFSSDHSLMPHDLRKWSAWQEALRRSAASKLLVFCPLPVACRDIVLASHLKPLEKKDKMGNKRNVLWNPCAGHTKGQQVGDVEIPQVREMLSGTLSTSKNYSKII